jgi:hypothetical protein
MWQYVRITMAAIAMSVLPVGGALAKSLALVIGNDGYLNLEPLAKARSDAQGYAVFLSARGFDVHQHLDVSTREMAEALAGFYDRIEPGDTVVVVYAGHGWSDGRENYLVPVDARASGSQSLLALESVPLRNGVNGILDQIAARSPGLTVAVIDACRNNPFTPLAGTRSIGLARGLTPVAVATGTFVAFSAGEGQTALDRLSDTDMAPYSVFTRVFLEEMARPQDLQTAFKATQARVNQVAATVGHSQRPAYYDEVIGSACLAGTCAAQVPIEVAAVSRPDAAVQARDEWRDFMNSESVAALTAFADRHAGSAYEFLARERIAILQRGDADLPKVPDFRNDMESMTAVAPVPSSPAPQAAAPDQVPTARVENLGAGFDAALEARAMAAALPTAQRVLIDGRRRHETAVAACRADTACVGDALRARQTELEEMLALHTMEPARRAQALLNRMGCDAGPADGVPGPRTRRALEMAARHSGTTLAPADLTDAQAVDALFAHVPHSCSVLAGGLRDPEVLLGPWNLAMQCPGTGSRSGRIEVRYVSVDKQANGPAGIGRKFGWHTLVPDTDGATLTVRWADSAPTVFRLAPTDRPQEVTVEGPEPGCRTTLRRG